MRFRLPLVFLLAGTLVWWGCEDQMAPEPESVDAPVFAKGGGGPPPDECDLKGLPIGDYFGKVHAREISALVKDLSAACVDGLQEGDGSATALGFQILNAVDQELANSPDFEAGGKIVAGVWRAVQYNSGTGFACSDCDSHTVEWVDVADAMQFGAFGVRSSGSEPVVSMGDYPDIWGIQTEGSADWSSVVPLGWVLIYGSDLEYGVSETPLTTGFDWNVVPWFRNPVVTTTPLHVGTCVTSTGSNLPLVAHVTALLPEGDSPSYCQQQTGLGDWVLQVASAAIPFWPQPLNASVMVGVSGSGKAREFSPFYQYDVAPYAAVTFTPLPDDGYADADICPAAAAAGPWCTLVEWETEGGSTIASIETLRFTTEANSSSWADVDMCVKPVDEAGDFIEVFNPDTEELEDVEFCTDYTTTPPSPPEATCDGRESAADRCVGLAVTSFTSNKTGSHRICVREVGSGEASGLAFDACTATFNIRP